MQEYIRQFCPECGSETASGVKYCSVCGTKLVEQPVAYTKSTSAPKYEVSFLDRIIGAGGGILLTILLIILLSYFLKIQFPLPIALVIVILFGIIGFFLKRS